MRAERYVTSVGCFYLIEEVREPVIRQHTVAHLNILRPLIGLADLQQALLAQAERILDLVLEAREEFIAAITLESGELE